MSKLTEELLRVTGEFEEEDIKEAAEFVDVQVKATMELLNTDIMKMPASRLLGLKKKEN